MSERLIKPGDKFGNFVVLRVATPEEEKPLKCKRKQFVCQCACGEHVVIIGRTLSRWTGVDYSKSNFKDRRSWSKPFACEKCLRGYYENLRSNDLQK